jgi:TRAP-type C4-dicarboxylate transport system substrate-binding protein
MSVRSTGGLAAFLACTFWLGISTNAASQPKELRYTTGAPPKTPWVMQLERFEQDVTNTSGGKLKIVSFINAQLGNEQDTMQQVARGRIDMGGFSLAAAALLVPELAIFGMPFLFESAEQQDCVLDKHFTTTARDMLAKRGVVFIGWSHVGAVSIIGKKPYVTPAEVKGLKSRSSPTKVGTAFWTALGANPNPIGITEWASAHQTGLVDVADAPVTYYIPSGLNKIAPVYTLTQHIDAPGIIVVAKSVWDKLSTEERRQVEEAASLRSAAQLRQEIRGFEATLVGMHEKGGGQVVRLTKEQRDAWRKAIEPAWPKMLETVGGEAPRIWQILQDGRKACGGKSA